MIGPAFRRIVLALGLALMPGTGAATPAPPGARPLDGTFWSRDNFIVHFPGDWTQLGTDNGMGLSSSLLYIASVPRNTEGVTFGHGWAEIIVRWVNEPEFLPLLDRGRLVRPPLLGMIARRRFGPDERGGCADLREYVADFDLGARTGVVREHVLICRIGDRSYKTALRYGRGEVRAEAFRQTALAITRSIRRD